MRFVPALSCLLLALQLVSAIQLNHRHGVRFVKMKRAVAGKGTGSDQDLPNLVRRGPPVTGEAAVGVKDLIEKIEGKGKEVATQRELAADATHMGSSRRPGSPEPLTYLEQPAKTLPVHEHTAPRLAPEEIYRAPSRALTEDDRIMLRAHEERLDQHMHLIKQQHAIDELNDVLLKSQQAKLEHLEELVKKTHKKLGSGISRKHLLALYAMLGVEGVVTLGVVANGANAVSKQSTKIEEQGREIDRLRSAQQPAAYVSGPGADQAGAPATAQGSPAAGGGGLV